MKKILKIIIHFLQAIYATWYGKESQAKYRYQQQEEIYNKDKET